jgi:hypothetical protein
MHGCMYHTQNQMVDVHDEKCTYQLQVSVAIPFLQMKINYNGTIQSHIWSKGPWLERHAISYSCASGLKVIEMNSSICMVNGQWEPDPSDITCTGNHSDTA